VSIRSEKNAKDYGKEHFTASMGERKGPIRQKELLISAAQKENYSFNQQLKKKSAGCGEDEARPQKKK